MNILYNEFEGSEIMASYNVHLAVAKRYLDKNAINDKTEFYKGTIHPDLKEYEDKLHYTDFANRDRNNLKQYLQCKTNLLNFLLDHNIENDYNKAVFLHLVTDWLFYHDFFDIDYLSNVSFDDFVKDLYYSYTLCNRYMQEKYPVDLNIFDEEILEELRKQKEIKNVKRRNILEIDKLEAFIERTSSINLEEYKNKILELKANVLPEAESSSKIL